MEQRDDEFEKGIEEINGEEKFSSKNNFRRNNQHNENHQKFKDRNFREQKNLEQNSIKSSMGGLGAMSELARKNLSNALNKKAESVISISKQEGGWVSEIEVIDEEYLPEIELKSMNDIIGTYEVQLDDKGELVSWNKKSSRKRGEIK